MIHGDASRVHRYRLISSSFLLPFAFLTNDEYVILDLGFLTVLCTQNFEKLKIDGSYFLIYFTRLPKIAENLRSIISMTLYNL